jgi:hypothetical protein
MTLDASSYFDHIKAYISDEYIVHHGDGGEIVLPEKYFREGHTKKPRVSYACLTKEKPSLSSLMGEITHFSTF